VRTLLIIVTLIALEITARADESAEMLFTEAQAAYDQHDYATAIAKWQESYRLSGANDLIFNIAQAMRLSGDCRGAITSYQRFSEIDHSDQAAIARGFVRELEVWCPEAATPPVDVPVGTTVEAPKPFGASTGVLTGTSTTAPRSRARDRNLEIAGLAAGGAGLAAIAAGLGLGHHGAVLGDEVTAACQTSCYWATEKTVDAAGRRDVAIGYAIDEIGVATVIGGGIAYYLGVRRGSIEPRDSGAVVSWRGAW
jgi:hypothetical protein